MIAPSPSRNITRKLEALFEFCYTGNYSEIKPTGDDLVAWTKSLFMQHARVFVAADKYMAQGLAKLALQRLEDRVMCEVKNAERIFYKFAVDQVYLHQNLLGYDQQHTDEDARFREESAMGEHTEEEVDPEMKVPWSDPYNMPALKKAERSGLIPAEKDTYMQDEDINEEESIALY
jgi:hypothetical protein